MAEKVINGVLCHNTSPSHGGWEPFSIEALTTSLVSTRKSLDRYSDLYVEALKKLDEIHKLSEFDQ